VRERREDIPVLADFFFKKFARARGIDMAAVSPHRALRSRGVLAWQPSRGRRGGGGPGRQRLTPGNIPL